MGKKGEAIMEGKAMANEVPYISMRGLPSWANGNLELVRKKMDLYVQYRTGDLTVPIIGKYVKEAYAGNKNSSPTITGFNVRPDLLMGLIWASNNLFGHGGYPLSDKEKKDNFFFLRTKSKTEYNPLDLQCGLFKRIEPENWRMGVLFLAARIQSFFDAPGVNDHPNGKQFDPCYRAQVAGDWERLTQYWKRPSDDLYGICALLLRNWTATGIDKNAIALAEKTIEYAEAIRATDAGSGNGGDNGGGNDNDNDPGPIGDNVIPLLPSMKDVTRLVSDYWWIGVGAMGIAYLLYDMRRKKVQPVKNGRRNIGSSVEE